MENNTKRFSDRVANYILYRPHYPKALITFLTNEIQLNQNYIIADIGSGTGISAELFIANNNLIYAVEPNAEMRFAAEKIFQDKTNFKSIDGTAENTNIENESIDFIISGQAFHWFDKTAFKNECKRIAKTNAYCMLFWNDRLTNTPFLLAYEKIVHKYATDQIAANQRVQINEIICDFFAPNIFITKSFNNYQSLNFESLKGRLLSSSYAPNELHPNYQLMIKELQELFELYQEDNHIKINYETRIYLGQIN